MKSKVKRQSKKPFSNQKIKKTFLGLLVTLILLGFSWTTDKLTTATLPTSNDPPLLYSNQCQDDLQLTLSSAIKQAKDSVLLMIYTLSDEKIIQGLKQKSEQGVKVKVVCDGKASPFVERKLGSKVDVIKRFGDGLMHLKILVIDQSQVWIGSANMTTESLKMHGNLILAIQSQALGKLMETKANQLPEEGKSISLPPEEFLIGGQKVEMWFLPSNSKPIDRLINLISLAKETISVAMFTWTRMDLAQAVVKAANKGVKVEVVLDQYAAKGASSKVAKFLQKNGIPTYYNRSGGLLHHKFLYVDKTLVNGSANWTKAALDGANDDCFVILNDLSTLQQEQMNKLCKILKKESTKQ
jgi:cardiolipin synthase A/B